MHPTEDFLCLGNLFVDLVSLALVGVLAAVPQVPDFVFEVICLVAQHGDPRRLGDALRCNVSDTHVFPQVVARAALTSWCAVRRWRSRAEHVFLASDFHLLWFTVRTDDDLEIIDVGLVHGRVDRDRWIGHGVCGAEAGRSTKP